MNVVERYVEDHREALGLDALGVPRAAASLLLTPRFPLSRHIVMLLLDGERPVLVAKLPRVAGDGAALAREAANLRIAHTAAAGTGAAVPRLVAFDEEQPHPLLLETAIAGRPLSPAALRRDRGRAVAAMAACLGEVAERTAGPADDGWYGPLVREPLERLAALARGDRDVAAAIAATLELTAGLAGARLPRVLEHGDLAHPNLLALADGRVGVLDWEAGTSRGLPLHDLVFFLGYVATTAARRRAGHAQAIAAAFAQPGGWAWPVLAEYARRLAIGANLLGPLVVASAARAVAALPDREGGIRSIGDGPWLLGSRQMTLWRHLLAQAEDLRRTTREDQG